MLNYKILVKITGSIAAYKSAYLISRLVQDGYEVKTVASESALKFIGKATLEGLTGSPVYTDSFEEGRMMSHINLVKWADLTIVCPASANTINKLAAGIGDSLLTSLFLAHDRSKPYLIAPAMNTAMFNHPATQNSLKKLSEWGVRILPTAEGYLACGDYGSGKLLEPDSIISHIYTELNRNNSKGKVLITAGGTKENIDGIRSITNLSTGKTASSLAQHFINKGYNVTYLCTADTLKPNGPYRQEVFTDFKSLNETLNNILENESYDLTIHNAAVSDYSPHSVVTEDTTIEAPVGSKIPSSGETLTLNLKKNFKIVNRIRNYSANKNLLLVAFKFTNDPDENRRMQQVNNLLASSGADLVVQNDFSDRVNNEQRNFRIYSKDELIGNVTTVNELAGELEQYLIKTKED